MLRSVSVVAAALTSLVGLKVLLKLPEAEGVVLIAVLGWMVFMPLGQFGYGRPVYGWLRRDHESSILNPNLTEYFLVLTRRQAVLASLILCLLGLAYAARNSPAPFVLTVAVFALGMASLNSGIYQRDIAYALSHERDYETMELCRRFILLFGILALSVGLPIWVLGMLAFLVGVLTQQRLSRILNPSRTTSALTLASGPDRMAGLRRDARRFLFFTTNELLLYNLPLVVLSVLGSAPEIIFISIWMRLFQLLVLPMRLGVDARMNRLVSAYFRGNREMVRQGLVQNVAGSVALTGVILVLLAYFKSSIFGWIGATALGDDPYILPSLAIWGLSNTLQHAFGSFTLSYGGGFSFASLMSLLTFLSTGLAFGVMLLLHMPLGQILIFTGLIYGLFALKYGVHVFSLLKHPGTCL